MRLVHLEKLRRLKGWTQEEAANKAGVARSTYANWENGKREPDFETSEKLTQLFEVSLDYLLGKSKFINAELLAEEYTALKSQDTTNVLEGENMSLGKRLKAERNKKGWSQIVVAQKLGITNTVLSNYERDYRDPDTETLTKLAELYETSTDYLLRALTNYTFDGNIQETP